MKERALTRSEISARYNKKMAVTLNISLNRKTDADIIEYLTGVDNRAGYVKRLIRKDMKTGDA